MDEHGRNTDCEVGRKWLWNLWNSNVHKSNESNESKHMTGTLTTNEMCVVKLAMPDPSGSMKAWDVEGHNYTPVGRVHDMTINWAKAQAVQMLAKIGCMCYWVLREDGNLFWVPGVLPLLLFEDDERGFLWTLVKNITSTIWWLLDFSLGSCLDTCQRLGFPSPSEFLYRMGGLVLFETGHSIVQPYYI